MLRLRRSRGYAVIEGPIIYDDELGNVDLHHHDLDDYVADLQPVDEEDASAKARQRPPAGPASGVHNSRPHMNVDHSEGWQHPPHALRLAGSEPATIRQTLPRE